MANPYGGFNISPLQPGERIASWEKFFRSAVASLLTQEGGQKLTIGLLPAYVCRRPAEKETVKDIVHESEDLDSAFQALIRCLDPPIDPQQALLMLCHKEWEAGVPVDNYFYELHDASVDAEAPMRMACLVLISQMPQPAQNPLKEWIAAREDVTKPIARDFIVMVRKTLTERGITLDQGNRDLNRILEVRTSASERIPVQEYVKSESEEGSKQNDPPVGYHTKQEEATWREGINTIRRRNYPSIPSKSTYAAVKETKFQVKPPACYGCGDTRHFQRKCPRQYCQQCGKQGHHRRDCFSSKPVMTLGETNPNRRDTPSGQSGVVVRVSLNGYRTRALLDSGAQPSVVDLRPSTLSALGTDTDAVRYTECARRQ